VKGVESLNNS